MNRTAILEYARAKAPSDEQVVERVLQGETALYEILMRRHNQRIYRAARAILGSDAEAEDVMQDAYVRAYQHLGQFEGRSKFSTWLTRIAVHEALARREKLKREQPIEVTPTGEQTATHRIEDREAMKRWNANPADPERQAFQGEIGRLLEEAIDSLPDKYRSVLVLRDVEELDTFETAQSLGLTEEAVKVRLHRARALVRRGLYAHVGAAGPQAFRFHAERCDRVVAAVFSHLNS